MKNILLVDCEQFDVDIISDALADESRYKLAVCNSGFTAYEAIDIKRFDLIIIAEELPYLSGLKTARGIRKKIGFEVSPFAIITSRITEAVVNEFTSVGVAGFIDRPIRQIKVAGVANRILNTWKTPNDNYKSYIDYQKKLLER